MILIKDGIPKILLYLVLLTLFAGCTSSLEYPAYLSATTTYDLNIKSDGSLSNATFYIPLPVRNDTPMVGSRELFPEDFQKPGYSVIFTKVLPAYNYSGEYLVPDSNPWYVRISSDQWPNSSYNIEIVNGSYSFHSPGEFLETRFPLGNQSVFLPKFNFTIPQSERKHPFISFSPRIEYDTKNVPQTIPVYADYSAKPGAVVEIGFRLRGENSWLDGPDQWYTNGYTDVFSIRLKGQQNGWYPSSEKIVDGWFQVAYGIYPDLTEPKWEKFTNETIAK